MALSAAVNGTAYIGLTYMTIHLSKQVGYDATPVYWVATIAIGLSALCMPFGGMIGDKIGLVRLMAIGFVGYIVLTYPLMSVMPSSLLIATISYVLIMMNTVAAQVGAYTILPQLFDKQSRYTRRRAGLELRCHHCRRFSPVRGCVARRANRQQSLAGILRNWARSRRTAGLVDYPAEAHRPCRSTH